jgi:hypothetical protein
MALCAERNPEMFFSSLDKPILDLQGNPLKADEKTELTYRAAMVQALAHETPPNPRTGEQSATGEDRFRRWSVANKIQNAKEAVELTTEEVSLLKTKVGEAFVMVVVGPVWTFIESAKKEGDVQ